MAFKPINGYAVYDTITLIEVDLDSLLEEKIKLARNSFSQLYYNELTNPKIILSYNFFIPENYNKNKKYPLIVYIGDETTYGKEITLPVNKTVGGPIWATKLVQEEHNSFIFIPHFNENILDIKEENIKNDYLNIIIKMVFKIQNELNLDLNRIN